MFGLGANELVIILIFGFIIFGPDKLPGMAKTIGQAIAKFRNAQAEMSRVIKTEVYDPDAEDPFKNPLDALSKLETQAKKEDRGESFTERKARYDKQRAARKAADERKAELAAKREAEKAAKEAATEAGADYEGINEAGKAAVAAVEAKLVEEKEAKAAEEAQAAKKKPTAEELYGTKPVAKKPKPKKAESESDAKKEAAAQKAAAEPIDKQVEEALDTADSTNASAASDEADSTNASVAPSAAATPEEGKGE